MLFAPRIVIVIISIVIFYILLLVIEMAAVRALRIHQSGNALSFMFGFLLASFLCLVLYIAIVFTGAVNYLTGALAERWTKQEFAVLGSEWHIFSNVPFSVGFGDKAYEIDVDHIVVGPYGILVLETKFSSSPVDLGSSQIEKRVSEAMVQVEDNAGRVRALLRQVDPEVPIRPVVIFWGRPVKPSQNPVRRVPGRESDIRIVHGGDAKKWRPRLTEKVVITPLMVEELTAKIQTYVTKMKRPSIT
jgi:hypothetical protein